MELRDWILDDLELVHTRISKQVLGIVPSERWHEQVDGGGSTIVTVLWHLSRHIDVGFNAVLLGGDEILGEWASRLSDRDVSGGPGLAEAGDTDVVDTLDPEAVAGYWDALMTGVRAWAPEADLSALDTVPDSAAGLARVGVPEDGYPWLYKMWSGQKGAFYLRWETIGHGITHLGEMVSIRNRMGLSPF